MKKILLTALFVLFSVSYANAAGDCVYTSKQDSLDGKLMYIKYTCTAHTDNSLSTAFTDAEMSHMDGGYIYYLTVTPGATACTDASDLAITDEYNLTPYTAAGYGANLVDATSTTGSIPENLGGDNWYYPVVRENNITLVMTNNAVASCIFDATFIVDKK